jgi:secondary thiamine-phosphate synthase enzyme
MVAYDWHAEYFGESRKCGSRALRGRVELLGIRRGTTMEVLKVKTARRTQLVDVTDEVEKAAKGTGVSSGVCYVYVPHTTAGVIINEHFDPDVASDLEAVFDRLVPRSGSYRHSEGNSDAHAKAAMTGSSQMILVEHGKLALGRWQGVFFCEFDGPRERNVWVKVIGNPS